MPSAALVQTVAPRGQQERSGPLRTVMRREKTSHSFPVYDRTNTIRTQYCSIGMCNPIRYDHAM